MKNSIIYPLVLFFFICSCSQKHYTVIKNVTVFDGHTVHTDAHFVFADSTIVGIFPKSQRFRNASVIDGQGKTILPPLINAHVHIREPQNLKDAQQEGIFALLDLFSTDDRANYLRSFNDSLRYARCYSANFGATVPGGHGTQFRVAVPTIGESLSPSQFVEDRKAQRADFIKITQEASMAQLSRKQLTELVAAARKHELKTIAHMSDLDNAVLLSEVGVDGLAHSWYRKGSRATRDQLRRFGEQGTFLIPTLSVIKKVLDRARTLGVQEDYLPFDTVLQEVRQAHLAGMVILAGSDAPNYGMNYTTQLFEELQLLQRCGLPATEVLKTATTNIYEAFGLSDFTPLQKGHPAGFLLLNGNPFQDLKALYAEKRVWKKGQEISYE